MLYSAILFEGLNRLPKIYVYVHMCMCAYTYIQIKICISPQQNDIIFSCIRHKEYIKVGQIGDNSFSLLAN